MPPNEEASGKFSVGQDFGRLLETQESMGEVVGRHTAILAEHQGTLKGVFSAISAVQASLGAWLAVVGIVTSVLVALGIFNLTRTNGVGDQVAAQNQRLDGMEVRLGGG